MIPILQGPLHVLYRHNDQCFGIQSRAGFILSAVGVFASKLNLALRYPRCYQKEDVEPLVEVQKCVGGF